MQSRDRLFYQYALLNLAIVQSDFGCHSEAVATLLEAIATARENRDATCLNFALNWLYHFGRNHPNLVRDLEDGSMLGSAKESLAFLRAKAKETGAWILWSSALLSDAKRALANGESVSVVIENMVRSSQLIVERNMRAMMGAQLSLAVAVWDRLGVALMSNMICEVFLRCHADFSVFDDQLKITCRLAGLLSSKGKYEEAFERLEGTESHALRSAKPSQYWRMCRGLLKLRRDLHHNNLEAADVLLSELLQIGPENLEPDMVFVVDAMNIEALVRRRNFGAALLEVNRIMSELREGNRDIALLVRMLLAKAHLFDRSGRTEKGFAMAMRAASMAWRARLVALLWQAVGAAANVLNSLGEFAAAEQLLVAVLPRCLETDLVFTAGTLYSLLADARMGMIGAMKDCSAVPERDRMLAKVHRALDSAINCFSAVEDADMRREVLAKKAMLFRVEGHSEEAETCEEAYLGVWGQELVMKG